MRIISFELHFNEDIIKFYFVSFVMMSQTLLLPLSRKNNCSVSELELNQKQLHKPFKCHSILKTILIQKFDKTLSTVNNHQMSHLLFLLFISTFSTKPFYAEFNSLNNIQIKWV